MNPIHIYLWTGREDELIRLSSEWIKLIQKDRSVVHRFKTPRNLLYDLYHHLRKELPDLDRETKERIWKESGKDKVLAKALYVIEVL
jgi:hypothetical protein